MSCIISFWKMTLPGVAAMRDAELEIVGRAALDQPARRGGVGEHVGEAGQQADAAALERLA